MDEPFGALDPVNRARLQDLVLDVWSNASPRKTVVFVTHDMRNRSILADRVIMLGSSPGRKSRTARAVCASAFAAHPAGSPESRRCRSRSPNVSGRDTLQRMKLIGCQRRGGGHLMKAIMAESRITSSTNVRPPPGCGETNRLNLPVSPNSGCALQARGALFLLGMCCSWNRQYLDSFAARIFPFAGG